MSFKIPTISAMCCKRGLTKQQKQCQKISLSFDSVSVISFVWFGFRYRYAGNTLHNIMLGLRN